MITMLGQWPIGVPIALILIAVGILVLLGIAIGLVRVLPWLGKIRNRTGQSIQKPILPQQPLESGELPRDSISLKIGPETSTGSNPGGVSYLLPEAWPSSRKIWIKNDYSTPHFRSVKSLGGAFRKPRMK